MCPKWEGGFPGSLKLGPPGLCRFHNIPARQELSLYIAKDKIGASKRPSDPSGVPMVMFFPLVRIVTPKGMGRLSDPMKKMNLWECPAFPGLFLFAGGEDLPSLDPVFLWKGNSPHNTPGLPLLPSGLREGIARQCSDSLPCLGILPFCRLSHMGLEKKCL